MRRNRRRGNDAEVIWKLGDGKIDNINHRDKLCDQKYF
jgi:hypothetical protein